MIVVTDGSGILGLGDLGVQGIGIAIGKLDLYVAAAGINPHRVLPVMIDVGTNNEKFLEDPLYLGLQQHRLDGDEYIAVIDEFMEAVFIRWPRVIVQVLLLDVEVDVEQAFHVMYDEIVSIRPVFLLEAEEKKRAES